MSQPEKPPVRLGELKFEYEQPTVDVDGGAETAEHTLLPSEEVPDAPDVVVQSMGSRPKQIELNGICTLSEANVLDTFDRGDEMTLQSYRHSGPVILTDYTTDTYGTADGGHGARNGEYLYEFIVRLTGY